MFLVVLAIGCACAETIPSCRVESTRWHHTQLKNFTNPKGTFVIPELDVDIVLQLSVLKICTHSKRNGQGIGLWSPITFFQFSTKLAKLKFKIIF